MKRIVVGIDGSQQGWAALASAAQLARSTGAGLQIAHVSPAATGPLDALDYQAAFASGNEAQENYAQGLLREGAARVQDTGVEVSKVSRIGHPAEVLAELAAPADVTMVVVGHRGRNAMARLLIGSVADRLMQIAPKPVLIIR